MKIKIANSNKLKFWFLSMTLGLFVLFLGGFAPGGFGNLSAQYIAIGAIECGENSLSVILESRCSNTGFPVGGIFPTNGPFYTVGSIINRIPLVEAELAYRMTAMLFIALAMLGAYKFFGLFIKSRYISLYFSFVYLVSPIVFNMHGLGGTGWGVALLPLYFYLVAKLARYFRDTLLKLSNTFKLLSIFGALTLISTFALFLDGYSFFMFIVSSSIIALAILAGKSKKQLLKLALFEALLGVSALIAFVIFRSMLSVEEFSRSDIGIFRSMSADLATIVLPSVKQQLAGLLSVGQTWSALWGDGTNKNNYMGIVFILLSLASILLLIKNKRLIKNKLTIAIVLIGVMGFVLGIGPTVKLNTKKEPVEGPITYSSYLMPKDTGIIELPTEDLYKLPGFSSMRATYRWLVLTQISILVLSALMVEKLSKRTRVGWVIAILLLGLVDIMPRIPQRPIENMSRYSQFSSFNSEVITPLKLNLDRGEKVIFYPNARGNNDYLANYISPVTGVVSYNVGNDKALNNAKSNWPADVKRLITDENLNSKQAEKIALRLLKNDDIDALIIPNFDLRWDSYSWPASNSNIKSAELERKLLDNSQLELIITQEVTIVRLR